MIIAVVISSWITPSTYSVKQSRMCARSGGPSPALTSALQSPGAAYRGPWPRGRSAAEALRSVIATGRTNSPGTPLTTSGLPDPDNTVACSSKRARPPFGGPRATGWAARRHPRDLRGHTRPGRLRLSTRSAAVCPAAGLSRRGTRPVRRRAGSPCAAGGPSSDRASRSG